MNIDFLEVHGGREQTILMTVLTKPNTALERQIWESITIDMLARSPESCLNLKLEWGLSRTPRLINKDKQPARKKLEQGYKGRRERQKPVEKGDKQEEDPQPRKRQRKEEAGPEKEGNDGTPLGKKEVRKVSGWKKGEFLTNTPIMVKVHRINKRMREEQEEGSRIPRRGEK